MDFTSKFHLSTLLLPYYLYEIQIQFENSNEHLTTFVSIHDDFTTQNGKPRT
jgi:hypothetical protein